MTITDKIAKQNVNDFHLIVTNHPYMIELGLGTFTTGTLYAWWNERTNDGLYLNRMSINGTRDKATLEAPPNNLDVLLGITEDTEFFWQGWKPNKDFQNAGVYKKQNLKDYGTGWGGEAAEAWEFQSAVGTVKMNNLLSSPDFSDPLQAIIGGTLASGSLDFEPIYAAPDPGPSGAAFGDPFVLSAIKPVYDLININRYMTSFTDYYPRSLWDKNETTIGGANTKELFATHELLTEIKSSKIGAYIEWSGEVTFHINENNGTVQCPITEWVPFKLYLFSKSQSQAKNKVVTVKNLTYVAPKRDVTGRKFATTEDGGHTDVDPDDVANHGASEIDVSINPITKKWESGTPTLFAKLVTDIGLPQSMPSIERLESNDIKQDLESDEYNEVKLIPASGTAMPIRPQNGNPHQWQPNYLQPDDVRCEDQENNREKQTLTVYNFNTRRKYERDEEVFISRIDGMWQVTPLWPSSGVEDEEVVSSDVGKWGEFTYLMTNGQFFFRAKNGARFSPRDAELSFHKLYYAGDSNNDGVDYKQEGGYDRLQPFSTKNTTPIELEHGYWQITSFDSLDSKLYGIRGEPGRHGQNDDKCSIATTSAVINAAGSVIPAPMPDYASRNGAHSSTFFGCLFPAGYSTVDQYTEDRDFAVRATSAGLLDPTLYMKTAGATNTDRPFFAANPTSDRNNCRQPAGSDPLEQLTGDNNSWSRVDSRASASLFAEYVQSNTTIFRQMPADVMLNASPEGKFGSPLYSVHRFKDFYDTTGDKHLNAAHAQLQAVWLAKEGTGGGGQYTSRSSAFDFPPVSRNNLMFRPLKMEAYVQFGGKNNDSDALAKVRDFSEDAGSHESRVGFQVEAHRTQIDLKRPLSHVIEDREEPHQKVTLGHGYFLSNYGLTWGGDIQQHGFRPTYTNVHEYSYWGDAMAWKSSWAGDWKGAGAYGVITTFNTVAANSQIDFTTDNIYGMGAGANGSFSIAKGQNQDRTWGVSSFFDSYRQENVIDLSVRIFQQHPRDALLYDPRTFAVHHFNPDIRYANNTFIKDDGWPEILNPIRNSGVEEINGRDAAGDPITYHYGYPLPSSTVDLQEVSRFQHHIDETFGGGTLHADQGNYNAQPVTGWILRNATFDGALQPPVINSKFWLVNTIRVGKLLPFRYETIEVGVPTQSGAIFTIGDGFVSILAGGLSNSTPMSIVDKMVVKNAGQDYAVGDKIGIANKAVLFQVKAVDATTKAITELECLNPGTGISAGQTAASGDIFNPDTDGPLKLNTLQSGEGGGFDAYFVAAKPWLVIRTDPKPYLMKRDGEEIVRIAADVPQGTHDTTGKTPEAEGGAFVNESREVTYILDPTLLSENKQYDIFFHFHNDVTMTWLAGNQRFHGDTNNVSEVAEQFVSVRINPR